MLCKIAFQGQNKVVKLKETDELGTLEALIRKYYPSVGDSYELYYLDEEEDEISLTTEQDFEVFKEKKKPNLKLYVKSSANGSVNHIIGREESIDHSRRSELAFRSVKQSRFINEFVREHQEQSSLKEDSKRPIFIRPQQEYENRYESYSQFARREEIHGVSCSKCSKREIIGVRYQCPFCFDYNLCEVCEREDDHPHSLAKVKKANRELNYEELRNHLNLELPDDDLINGSKELEQLRRKCSSLMKINEDLEKEAAKQRKSPLFNVDRFKEEKEVLKRQTEEKIRQARGHVGSFIDRTFDRSREIPRSSSRHLFESSLYDPYHPPSSFTAEYFHRRGLHDPYFPRDF